MLELRRVDWSVRHPKRSGGEPQRATLQDTRFMVTVGHVTGCHIAQHIMKDVTSNAASRTIDLAT